MALKLKAEKYKALLVMVTGFAVLYYFFRERTIGIYFLYTALAVGVLSIFIPVAGDWIVKGWYKLAELLGWLNGRILLSLVFFLFLTPLAYLYRMFAKNPLRLKRAKESLFDVRDHKYKAKDLEDLW